MSFSNGQNNLASSASVIECPSCTTRFAIDCQQVAHIEEPIFHCSRCGHYFGIKNQQEQVETIESVEELFPQEEPQLEFQNEIAEHAEQLDLMSEDINPQPDFTAPEISSKQSWYKRGEFNFEDSSGEEEITVKADWPNASPPEPIKFTYENKTSETKKVQEPNKKSYYIPSDSNYYLDLSELEDELSEDVDSVYLPPAKGVETKSLLGRFLKSSSKRQSIEIDEPEYIEIEDSEQNQDVSLFKPALIIMSFPVLFALLLAFWGFNIDKTPAILMSFFNFDSKLLATVAPSGLALTSLSPEIVTLDSGERAFRIKGDVINSTANTFSNLTLEAKLFTKDNRELVRVIAPLDNALRDSENISALNADSIERLQSESAEQVTTIQPNIKIPFSLVVPGVKGEEAWYSARIYSVVKI